MASATTETVIGAVIYAPLIPEYHIQHLIFTDKRLLAMSASKVTSAVSKGSAIGAIGMFLAGANPFTVYGISGMMGMGVWKDIKKKNAGKTFVKIEQEKSELGSEIESIAEIKMPYDKVKEASFKKMWGAEDYLVKIGKGYFSSQSWAVAPDAVAEVKMLLGRTPLAAVVKD